jgi:transcription initiation factor IIE alpha subunit
MFGCPVCKTKLGMDLQFILNQPESICPGCGLIFNFKMTDEMKRETLETLRKMEEIKKKMSKIAKFR